MDHESAPSCGFLAPECDACTGKVVAGDTCWELSGEVFKEEPGLGEIERETMYSSGYWLKSNRFQYARDGSPTLASEDFSVGFSA